MQLLKFPKQWIVSSLVSFACAASGAPILYEGFEYGLVDTATMEGVETNAIGLRGAYTVTNTGTAAAAYTADGLTFSQNFFATKGGAVKLSAMNPGATLAETIVTAPLATGNQTGTLWSSFLVKGASFATGTSATSSSSTAGYKMLSDTNYGEGRPGIGITNGYSQAPREVSLSPNTTYLFLSRFTHVGEDLSSINKAECTLWVFTEEAYNSWYAVGAKESDLDAYAMLLVNHRRSSGNYRFNNNYYMGFAANSGNLPGSQVLVYDEQRWGAKLTDVVPSHVALAVLWQARVPEVDEEILRDLGANQVWYSPVPNSLSEEQNSRRPAIIAQLQADGFPVQIGSGPDMKDSEHAAKIAENPSLRIERFEITPPLEEDTTGTLDIDLNAWAAGQQALAVVRKEPIPSFSFPTESEQHWRVIDMTTGETLPAASWTYTNGVIQVQSVVGHSYSALFMPGSNLAKADVAEPSLRQSVLTPVQNAMTLGADRFRPISLAYSSHNGAIPVDDYYSYTLSTSLNNINLFESTTGTSFDSLWFSPAGIRYTTDDPPSDGYLSWMEFTMDRVEALAADYVAMVHQAGPNKRARFFWGDGWVGIEPYLGSLEKAGYDEITNPSNLSIDVRRVVDIPSSIKKIVRIWNNQPENTTGVFTKTWKKLKRAALFRMPDGIELADNGLGTTIMGDSTTRADIRETLTDVRQLHALIGGKHSYDELLNIYIINAWGTIRSWSQTPASTYPSQQTLGALTDLPVNVRFLSLAEVSQGGIPADADVVMNVGEPGSAWSGGSHWSSVIADHIRTFVRNGGAFVGVDAPAVKDGVCLLADVLGLKDYTATESARQGLFTDKDVVRKFSTYSGSINNMLPLPWQSEWLQDLSETANGISSSVRASVFLNTGGQSGALWSSFLVNFQSYAPSTTANSVSKAGGLKTFPDTNYGNGRPGIGIVNGIKQASKTQLLVEGKTYLLVSRFTNVGSFPSVATMWCFDQDHYENWVAGNSDEAALDSAANFKIEYTMTNQTCAFDNTQKQAFELASGSDTGTQVVIFDEQRWGTNMAAVLPTSNSVTSPPVLHEGFNYMLSDGDSMAEIAATATGLQGTYTVEVTGTADATYTSNGLSFGSLFFSPEGGALKLSAKTTAFAKVNQHVSFTLDGATLVGGSGDGQHPIATVNSYGSGKAAYVTGYAVNNPLFDEFLKRLVYHVSGREDVFTVLDCPTPGGYVYFYPTENLLILYNQNAEDGMLLVRSTLVDKGSDALQLRPLLGAYGSILLQPGELAQGITFDVPPGEAAIFHVTAIAP